MLRLPLDHPISQTEEATPDARGLAPRLTRESEGRVFLGPLLDGLPADRRAAVRRILESGRPGGLRALRAALSGLEPAVQRAAMDIGERFLRATAGQATTQPEPFRSVMKSADALLERAELREAQEMHPLSISGHRSPTLEVRAARARGLALPGAAAENSDDVSPADLLRNVLRHPAHPIGPPPERNRSKYPYQGTLDFQGLRIRVENAAGTSRRGVSEDGRPWETPMLVHYGEFERTEGVDGDPLDVFVGPRRLAPFAYVVHAQNPRTRVYDEDKVMLGFGTRDEALAVFRAHYDRTGFLDSVRKLTIGELREWIAARENRGRRIDVGAPLAKAQIPAWMAAVDYRRSEHRLPDGVRKHEPESQAPSAQRSPQVRDQPRAPAGLQPRAEPKRPPTERQLDYAMQLIARAGQGPGSAWYDSDHGQGEATPPSRAALKGWSSAQVSALIEDLQDATRGNY